MWVICIIICVVLLNVPYFFSIENYNRTLMFRRFKFINSPIEIAAFGSGPGLYALDFEEKENCYNLCVWPEDFRYDFRMLKKISNRMQEGTVILHCISPLSFLRNEYLYKNDFNEKYAVVLKRKDVDVNFIHYYAERFFPIFNHPKRIVKMIIRRKKNELLSNTQLNDEEIKMDCKRNVENWLNNNDGLNDLEDSLQNIFFKDAFEMNKEMLKHISDFCDERGYQYFAVIIPINQYMKSFFSQQFLDEFLLNNIYSCVDPYKVINCMEQKKFENVSLYQNGLFLNKKGREAVTEYVLSKITH